MLRRVVRSLLALSRACWVPSRLTSLTSDSHAKAQLEDLDVVVRVASARLALPPPPALLRTSDTTTGAAVADVDVEAPVRSAA